MADWPLAPIAPPRGVPADQNIVRVINRSGGAIVRGQPMRFDLKSVASETTDFAVGSAASVLVNTALPEADFSQLLVNWTGIALEAAADNAEYRLCVRGIVDALVGGDDAAALTDNLTVLDGGTALTSNTGAVGSKVLGIPLEVSAGGTAELIKILFNGIEGLGYLAG